MRIGLKAYEGKEWEQVSYQKTPTAPIWGATMWKGRLVTTHQDGNINVWNLQTSNIVKTIQATGTLAQLCKAQDSIFAVMMSGYQFDLVKIDVDGGNVTTFNEPSQAFISLTTDGTYLWAQTARGPFWQIDPVAFKEMNTFHTGIQAPDLIQYSNETLVVGSGTNGTLTLFNSNNGQPIGKLEGGYTASGITVLPGGLIANNSRLESYPFLQVWDLATQTKLIQTKFDTTDSDPYSIVRRGDDYIVAGMDGVSVFGVTHFDYKGMLFENQLGSFESNGVMLALPDGGFVAALSSGWALWQPATPSNQEDNKDDVSCNQTFLNQIKSVMETYAKIRFK